MTEESGAICGDGMCPWVPCKDFPDCSHHKKFLEECEKERKADGFIL